MRTSTHLLKAKEVKKSANIVVNGFTITRFDQDYLQIYDTNIDNAATNAIIEFISQTPALAKIKIIRNYIDIDNLKKILMALSQLNSITEIDLDNNRTTVNEHPVVNHCAVEMYYLLKSNRRVTSLTLSANQLTDYFLDVIHLALMNAKIKVFNLTDNDITHMGAEVIASYISANRELELLNLSNNPLDDRGVIKIARALKYCSVKQLFLNQCRLTPAVFLEFVEPLKYNRSLTKISFLKNSFQPEDAAPLTEVFNQYNKSITFFAVANHVKQQPLIRKLVPEVMVLSCR